MPKIIAIFRALHLHVNHLPKHSKQVNVRVIQVFWSITEDSLLNQASKIEWSKS